MLYPETELDIYELQITFDIVEGLPALNLGQFILPRATGELLGTITIPNETVTTTSVHSGELPEGVSLSATGGGILVTDPQLLSDGTSTFEVYATSGAGVLYAVTVMVEFVEVIQLSPLNLGQFILPRTNNEVLGTIVIPNETINAASVHSGTLPTGVILTATGEIKVEDAQLLEDGDATFVVRAWTVSGLLHEVTVSIELVEVIQLSPLDLGQFILPRTNNEVLGTIVIPNETINAASVHSGTLPAGVILTATGQIKVEDAQLLEDGDATFVVRAWTVSGLLHEVTVSIELVEVIQLSPLDLGEFILPRANNEVLGAIVIPNETINAASVHSGTLPAGVILTATGQIKVEDAQLLEDGDATFVVRAWTVSGLLHEVSVSIALIEVIELSPLNLGRFILPLANDQLLGTITITNETVNGTSIYEGTVPAGVIVTSTGQIRVQNAQLLEPVEASFVVHAATVSGLLYAITVSVELAEATTISPIDLGQYLLPGTNGDLAGVIIIPNETVSATTVYNGEVPAGLVLGSNGELRVSVAGDLVVGTYSFDVYVDTTSGLLLDVSVTIELDDVTILAPLDFGQRTLPQPDETVLGTVTYTGITFTGFELVTGPMPDGTTVLQTGQFVVIESGAMQPGNYRFTMAGFDGAGDVYHFDIIIELVTD
jgi:invasion protein IalB